MDTKLKNTNNIGLKRALAFIFAILFVFTGAFGFFCFVRDAFYYNRLQSTGDYPGFTRTNSFRHNLNAAEQQILGSGEILTCETAEDYYKTTAGKAVLRRIEDGAEQIKAACDYLDSVEGLEVSVTDKNFYRYHYKSGTGDYYYTYNGELISEEEYESYVFIEDTELFTTALYDDSDEGFTAVTVSDNNSVNPAEEAATAAPETVPAGENATAATTKPAESPRNGEKNLFTKNTLNNISDALRIIWELTYNHGTGINYGEMPTDSIIEEYKKRELSGLSDVNNNIEFGGLENMLPSLKYAVFYNTTGKVLTNCGVKYGDDTETVLAKLGKTEYYEYIDGGEFTRSSEPEENRYREFIDFPGSPLESTENPAIERAFFAWQPSQDSYDAFTTGKTAYDSNIRSHAKAGSEGAFLGISIISFILACVCCVYLIAKAGVKDDGEAKMWITDKIPLLIRLGFAGAVTAACGALIFGIHYYEFYFVRLFEYQSFPHSLANMIASAPSVICAFLAVFAFTALIMLVCSCVRTIRCRTFFRYTFIGIFFRFFRFIFRKTRSLVSKIKDRAARSFSEDFAKNRGKKFIIRSAIAIIVFEILAIVIIAAADGHEGAVAFGIICALLLGAYAALLAVSFYRIASGISKIKEGKLDTAISKKLMPPFMRATAMDISGVRDGVSAAVNKAMKEQATKTELLTNVTHDLKTPLTSIINYVDLLKKTDDPAEQAEYLGILDDKSQRLKKLIDDLVQASKAASGNVEVNPVKLNLCEFASQIIGENEDELGDEGIELVLKLPDEPVFVYGDMNITNRIFENLLSNIRKYAMKGTRAYIEVTSGERFGLISFKNISAAPLETDTEKFTERFYRGDVSRTGDGNGLGLSIASNLCSAQGGILKIETDGDLFKAKVTIPAAASAGKED